jgi:hypothetical protein
MLAEAALHMGVTRVTVLQTLGSAVFVRGAHVCKRLKRKHELPQIQANAKVSPDEQNVCMLALAVCC